MKTDSIKKIHFASSGRMIVFSLLLVFFLQPVTITGQRSSLINVQWLSENLGNPDLVILDASAAQVYKAGHIPGALNFDLFTYGPRELPATEIEKRLQSWGISNDKKVIIYDQGGTMMATFLMFTLDYYGFPAKDIHLLDGGVSKWKEAGYQLTSEATPAPEKGSFKVKELNKGVKSGLPEFLNASGDTANNLLVEALDPSWHYGDLNVFGRRGHIPNAIMLPVSDFYNPDKTFKSNEEIERILDYLGIDPDKNVYTHCGGGIAASVPYFALKYLLGRPDVKLFQGSQLEWASDVRELPFWTYDAPYLIRDAGWLQSWNGRMMRMYGMSNLSLIDVRSPEAFREAHLEYAVNIDAMDLKKNLTSPGNLANILSLAGVNASTEVVILSGGGITREAAITFAALENAGQKKISLFIDPADKWEQNGFNLIKAKSEDGSSATNKNVSPQSYPVVSKAGVMITDTKSLNGYFPAVIISSGENAKGENGTKNIHIPYSQLLNADGTPKMAKEIWNTLSKAGVPRYASLVCNSDDPGEAAIVYFTLRLMGFPDVRILVE